MRMIGVRSNSFQVNFTDIPDALLYTIQVFFNNTFFGQTASNLTNVTITGVNPVENRMT